MNDLLPNSNRDAGDDTRSSSDRGSPPGMPGWVKVFGLIIIVLVLLVAFITITGIGGDHGPGRHAPFNGDLERHVRLSSITEVQLLSGGSLGDRASDILQGMQQL